MRVNVRTVLVLLLVVLLLVGGCGTPAAAAMVFVLVTGRGGYLPRHQNPP